MKAVTYNPAGNEFLVVELPIPVPTGFDVLIKVDACGLNPVDAKINLWKSRVQDMDHTWVPGLDVSGMIAAVGEDVQTWSIGDRVLYHGNMLRPHGGFAEYAIQDSRALIRHPDAPAVVAAATPCAGWTAWRALNDILHAGNGDSLLVAGGSGGVGGFAIQIARHLEVQPIIATCSAANRDYVMSLGATDVIDYAQEHIVDRVLEITDGRGTTLGLDTVGGDNDVAVADSLAPEGRMVELARSLRPDAYRDVAARGLVLHVLSLGAGLRNGPDALNVLLGAGAAFSKLVERGSIVVNPVRHICMEEVGPTLVEMLQQRTVGKIVMAV
jgi:NADPH:quinone reductase